MKLSDIDWKEKQFEEGALREFNKEKWKGERGPGKEREKEN